MAIKKIKIMQIFTITPEVIQKEFCIMSTRTEQKFVEAFKGRTFTKEELDKFSEFLSDFSDEKYQQGIDAQYFDPVLSMSLN